MNPTIKHIPYFYIILSLLIWVSPMGCGDEYDYTFVDFSETTQTKNIEIQSENNKLLKVAVAAMISPKETLSHYHHLLEYLGKELGYQIQLIQRKTYGEINELLGKGQIDVAFICTGPYVAEAEKYGFDALATPIVRGEPYYYSYLIVNKRSNIKTIEDLRGKRFAFTDPESNTGARVPRYWLLQLGETPRTFFKDVHYTFSHDNSITAVSESLVDGASVDSHIWEYFKLTNPQLTAKTTIIKKSIPFGSPPIVASKYLPADLKIKIQTILLSMHQNPAGKEVLFDLKIDRFDTPQKEWYQEAKRIMAILNDPRPN